MTIVMDCCVSDVDRKALLDLVTPLAYHPMRMTVDQRRVVVGPHHLRSVCRGCGKPRIRCISGCDLVPTVTWRVPAVQPV